MITALCLTGIFSGFLGFLKTFSITLLPAKTAPVNDISTHAAIPIFLNTNFSFLFIHSL